MPQQHKERQEQINKEMEFNKLVLTLPQKFKKKIFCIEDIKDFLETQQQLHGDAYVIFKSHCIPENLSQIITKDYPYHVAAVKDNQIKLFLDNDFQHWIDKKNIYICPADKVSKMRLIARPTVQY